LDFENWMDCTSGFCRIFGLWKFDQFVLTATTIQWPKTGKSMISDKPK